MDELPRQDKPVVLEYEPPPPPLAVPLYRKILAGILVLAGLAVAIAAIFQSHPAARTNTLTVAGGLIVWGVVIRFQHVQLGWNFRDRRNRR